ncbi:MAG: hypothetical protein FWD79_07290 [Desulfobulbus sp.]|nr:hypothetical protein [Desulfobulbus sp.]
MKKLSIVAFAMVSVMLFCNVKIACAYNANEKKELLERLIGKNSENMIKIENYLQLSDSDYIDKKMIKALSLKLFLSSSNYFGDLLLIAYSIDISIDRNVHEGINKMTSDITVPFYTMIAPNGCKIIKRDLEISSKSVGGMQAKVIQDTISLLDEFVLNFLT